MCSHFKNISDLFLSVKDVVVVVLEMVTGSSVSVTVPESFYAVVGTFGVVVVVVVPLSCST